MVAKNNALAPAEPEQSDLGIGCKVPVEKSDDPEHPVWHLAEILSVRNAEDGIEQAEFY
ncbi:hypothetical protein HK096_008429, partial [Nowakowskiella sp. JEL0078]